jgi:hypothetical protein
MLYFPMAIFVPPDYSSALRTSLAVGFFAELSFEYVERAGAGLVATGPASIRNEAACPRCNQNFSYCGATIVDHSKAQEWPRIRIAHRPERALTDGSLSMHFAPNPAQPLL